MHCGTHCGRGCIYGIGSGNRGCCSHAATRRTRRRLSVGLKAGNVFGESGYSRVVIDTRRWEIQSEASIHRAYPFGRHD